MSVYVVTQYGCNSSPSDMWIPHSKLFATYEEAYVYFLKVAPPDDSENKIERFVNDKETDDCIIESRQQIAGYHYGYGDCAKRPEGAVISRNVVTHK